MQYESTFNAIDNILRNEAGFLCEAFTYMSQRVKSTSNAKTRLNMNPAQIREFFPNLQHELYNGSAVISISA